jgi:hypothetical protein
MRKLIVCELQIIEEKLNNSFRKIIGYKTPKEIMDVAFKFGVCYSNKQKRFVALQHCIQDTLRLHR